MTVHLTSVVDAAADLTPVDLGQARARIAGQALHASGPGTVGLELEWHVVDRATPSVRVPWERMNEIITALGPMPAGSPLTMEPGGQVELSTLPAADVSSAVSALRRDAAVLHAALDNAGLAAVAVGADPSRPPWRTHPGDRYEAMATAFTAAGYGPSAAVMMCSTAALQVNLDAGPEDGWAARIAHLHALGPVLVAISACSPYLAGSATGWRSARMRNWGELDPLRTAPYAGCGDPAGAWASFALAAPVLVIREAATGVLRAPKQRAPLVDWVTGEVALDGRRPTRADVDYHLSTLWPPLRLRGFLEIRAMDAVPDRWWPGLAALAVAMVDDPVAADAVGAACEPVARAWQSAAQEGLGNPALRRAALACIEAALPAVPADLRSDAGAYADLIASGRTPGDLLAAAAAHDGPAAAFLAAAP